MYHLAYMYIFYLFILIFLIYFDFEWNLYSYFFKIILVLK